MPLEHPILMGTIGRAQGVRGEVRVKSHTGDPLALGDYGVLFDKDGKRFEVLDIRPNKNVVVVRFLGVNNRNDAEALNGTDLYIDRDQLPDEELDEGEFYYSDLEGMNVFDQHGEPWGKVAALYDFGSGDLIEVKANGKKPMLVPFTLDAVPEVNVEAGFIIINPQAAGLLDQTKESDIDPDIGDTPQDGA